MEKLNKLIDKWNDTRIDLLHWRRISPILEGREQSKLIEEILKDLRELANTCMPEEK